MAAPEPSGRTRSAPAVLVLGPTLARADVPLLCLRLRLMIGRRADRFVVCDVGALRAWDLDTVDALARLALDARRLGCRIALLRAPPDLPGMLALVGLGAILPCCGDSVLEGQRQPEQREEPLRIEEERDAGDPPV